MKSLAQAKTGLFKNCLTSKILTSDFFPIFPLETIEFLPVKEKPDLTEQKQKMFYNRT